MWRVQDEREREGRAVRAQADLCRQRGSFRLKEEGVAPGAVTRTTRG